MAAGSICSSAPLAPVSVAGYVRTLKVFVVIGLGYLVAPSAMLSIVGIDADPTANFLMRTEGVELFTGGGLLWALRAGDSRQRQVVLVSLAAYYVVGSLVDIAAFNDNIVGPASVPSG